MTERTPPSESPATSGALPTPTVSFTDAAERILRQVGEPMHYRDLTAKALEQGLITKSGKTPAATMNAQIGIDIERRQSRGEPPRFVRLGHGLLGLAATKPHGLLAQIDEQNQQVRQALADRLRAMPPADFEALIGRLLGELGFDEVAVTRYSGDGGIDVRGTLVVGDVIRTRMAVQVKRWTANVSAPTVHEVRGALGVHDQGLIITTSDFTAGARADAASPDRVPVALMNGAQLVALLVEHQIGVKRVEAAVLELAELEEEA